MSLPVFDGTGWIVGMPGLPGGVEDPDPVPDPVPTMGWTKAELVQFAADHEPPIPVPDGTKAEILAAILAYIDAHPEEN
jgi:hypothetical protein